MTVSVLKKLNSIEKSLPFTWKGASLFPSLLIVGFALIFWLLPTPSGLTEQNYRLLIIFLSTIAGIILKPLPMGAVTSIALTVCTCTRTLTLGEAFSTFSSNVVWLVVLAFFLAKGFIKTGLGTRIAYFFVKHLGRSSMGLAYGFTFTELILAPFIPSNTARGAGIIYPIVSALAHEQKSYPNHPSSKKIGAYMMLVCFHANTITSAMFLTALVGNPLIVSFAMGAGICLDWGTWFLAAILPGTLSLLSLPWLLHKLVPPSQEKGEEAVLMATARLQELGKLKPEEWLMLITFAGILFLWVAGNTLNVDPTVAALIGFSLLLFTGVIEWKDVLEDKGAWGTMMWFAPLLMMATQLTKLGFMAWFSHHISAVVAGYHWMTGFFILGLIYFYSHYMFASITAHVTALYSAFLLVLIALGAPPIISALSLAFLSSLSGTLTHYGSGTAPVFFGAGYVPVAKWWQVGFILSLINLLIWGGIGSLWWRILGYM